MSRNDARETGDECRRRSALDLREFLTSNTRVRTLRAVPSGRADFPLAALLWRASGASATWSAPELKFWPFRPAYGGQSLKIVEFTPHASFDRSQRMPEHKRKIDETIGASRTFNQLSTHKL